MASAREVTVLLIDSDSDSREICLSMFEHHGYAVVQATECDEALHLARETRPAVIITDLVRRTEAGWLIPEQLRADPVTATVPVIAVTGHVFPEDQERAMRAGVSVFLPKPVNLLQLLKEVEQLLNRPGAEA
ncbi:N/A [soil metagenome]